MTPPPSPSVLVLGGGPAGSTAARLLTAWGHDVRLITRPPSEVHRIESVPPSCGKLLDVVGARDVIDGLGFVRATGNTVWWGDEREPRVERFAGGSLGWQVERDVVDAALLDHARREGVTVDARVLSDDDVARVLADLSKGAVSGEEDGPLVLDCTGRAGLLARALGLRVYDGMPKVVALVATWQPNAPWSLPDDTHTLIESYVDGWAWSVPTRGGWRQFAVMVDPQKSRLARGAPARDVYLAELGKTRAFRTMTAGARLAEGPWGCDASTYAASRYAGDRWLLVGDAGSAIDPLSSTGLKKTFASAWLAAVVAHTSLSTPAMRDAARSFYDAREREVHRELTAMARRWLADAAGAYRAHPFWADRVGTAGEEGAAGVSTTAVQAAFVRLRAMADLRLRRAADLRIEPRPAVHGHRIVLEPRIVSGSEAQGVRHVRNVDVIVLLDLIDACDSVPQLVERYNEHAGFADWPDVLTALATALAHGWVVAQ